MHYYLSAAEPTKTCPTFQTLVALPFKPKKIMSVWKIRM